MATAYPDYSAYASMYSGATAPTSGSGTSKPATSGATFQKPNRKLSLGEGIYYAIAEQNRLQRLKELQEQGISDVEIEINYDDLAAGYGNKDRGFIYNGTSQEQFLKERESLQRKTDNKKRRGFINTMIAQNDEEGEIRRPSLLG